MNITFTDNILNWEDTGEDIMHKWMMSRELMLMSGFTDIHKTAFEATAFGTPSELPDRATLDKDVLEVADKSMPYYKEMYKHRIQMK